MLYYKINAMKNEKEIKEKNQDELAAEADFNETKASKKDNISMDDFRGEKLKDTPLTHYIPSDEQQYDDDDSQDKPEEDKL